jgi:hypothetical protein
LNGVFATIFGSTLLLILFGVSMNLKDHETRVIIMCLFQIRSHCQSTVWFILCEGMTLLTSEMNIPSLPKRNNGPLDCFTIICSMSDRTNSNLARKQFRAFQKNIPTQQLSNYSQNTVLTRRQGRVMRRWKWIVTPNPGGENCSAVATFLCINLPFRYIRFCLGSVRPVVLQCVKIFRFTPKYSRPRIWVRAMCDREKVIMASSRLLFK